VCEAETHALRQRLPIEIQDESQDSMTMKDGEEMCSRWHKPATFLKSEQRGRLATAAEITLKKGITGYCTSLIKVNPLAGYCSKPVLLH